MIILIQIKGVEYEMREENNLLSDIKPIFHTIIFEIKKQIKKIVFFTIFTLLILILQNVVLQALISINPLPLTQTGFYSNGLGFFNLIALFSACFFFSGVICEEYSTKTGYILFPKINKFELIIGKYIGNLIIVTFITTLFYCFLGLFGFYYYGGLMNIRFFYSYGIALLYIITLSSFVTFFSSFMKSVNLTIISTVLILLIGFNLADQIVTLVGAGNIEPLYSITYMGNLITSVLNETFPNPRYYEETFGNFTIGRWITPSIEMGITLMVIYILGYFIFGALLFKRRQL